MKILMFFHGGSKNRGCEAIVRSGIPIIKKYLPNAEISLASLDHETDVIIPGLHKIYDVSKTYIKKYTFNWLMSAYDVKIKKSENYTHRFENKKLLDLIPFYDVFLSVGGDNYCYGEQPWLYEVDRCIKKSGKKLILWGASIGEEDLTPTKIADLKSLDLILARESFTQKALEKNGLTNVKLCADGAFTMDKEELAFPEGWQEGNTIGFNYSPLVYKRNPESVVAAKKLIHHILDTTNSTICLTPHVIIPGNDDYDTLQNFHNDFKKSGRVILLPNTLNAIQYKGYISRMRMFIGARTHATIAAYSYNVPTMVLGYSIKSKGIANDIFGEEKLVLNISEISDSAKLISKFEEMKKEELQLQSLLKTKIPQIKEMSYKAGEYLAELVK
jgi:polysaccharide pyruvyl transferase WcaK-like protein